MPKFYVESGSARCVIRHQFPEDAGQQLITVTMLAAADNQRLDRKVVQAQGAGEIEVTFTVPAEQTGQSIKFAAYVGENSVGTPQHIRSAPLTVRIHDNATDIAVIANLYASNGQRNPYFKGGARGVVVNNLIDNPGSANSRLSRGSRRFRDRQTPVLFDWRLRSWRAFSRLWPPRTSRAISSDDVCTPSATIASSSRSPVVRAAIPPSFANRCHTALNLGCFSQGR